MKPGLEAPRLYRTVVTHARSGATAYRFRRRAFRLLVDVDRLAATADGVPGLGYNRFAPVSVYDRDFGPRDGSPLRPWIDAVLARAGLAQRPARVLLLCYPRLWGYQFNPLALWLCENEAGALVAVLCEVHNTFGEAHGYLLHRGGRAFGAVARGEHAKAFHVSPFIGMDARYRFAVRADARRLGIAIRESGSDGGAFLVAAERGTGYALSGRSLLAAWLAMPLMTLRISALIRWHALTLWLRGARWIRKPPPPERGISA